MQESDVFPKIPALPCFLGIFQVFGEWAPACAFSLLMGDPRNIATLEIAGSRRLIQILLIQNIAY
ncbi:MAG: hypothetical protein A2X25_12415 [Chloroflexi bacterium GWB2_49_20]|nr:MAG: hypothetical protein A2X25_12415 [Chloroflexi bacterium GWB2_49_20]OGN78474.1 MAG: hypothetical protein A2X26_01785 [Chloroflexi bacterium GWC2_49_37]OGN84063.1 MAG: hypothetical protein A2X27_13900 [Chloroflexi bacterium GWD2_49_16]HCM97405.1 hypothetical protein [Anaerolineae bacterium]